jgi:uncharacterized membrane protein YbhN (UPF0104 family)
MPAEDLTLGTPDLRALARRAALPAAAAAALVIAVVILGGPLRAFADALERAVDADPRWVAAAAAFELLSFGGYIALLWLVGGRASDRLGLRETTQITLGGAAATRLLPTAGAGGAALTLWALRRSGLGTRAAARTLLTFLVMLYAVFLASIVVSGVALAVEGEGLALTLIPAVLALVGIIVPLTAGLVRPTPGTGRLRTAASVLGDAVSDGFGHLRSVDPRLLGAFAWWGFDMAVLWAMLNAFGAPPALAVIVFSYFAGQVGNTIPVPGAVSGGLVGSLLAFGVEADLAIVSVLAYRAIAIWLPAPIGLLALTSLRRTIAGWSGEAAKTEVASPETAGPEILAPGRPVVVAAGGPETVAPEIVAPHGPRIVAPGRPAVVASAGPETAAPARAAETGADDPSAEPAVARPFPCERRPAWRPREAPARAAA